MKADPEQRAVQLGEYIAAHNATVRAAAAAFGCSKSTVHKDVAVRLRSISPALYGQVRAVLARNKAERHLRGGAATRRRYSRRKSPKRPLHCAAVFFLNHFFIEGAAKSGCFYPPVWNCCNAPFSSRLTCA